MIAIDKEKQAFLQEMMEVEKEMNQTAAQVRAYQSEIYSLKRNIKKNELTLKQLDNIKENRAIFIPLGKAFLSRTHDQIKVTLSSANIKMEEEAKQCEKSRQYYDEKRKEKEQIVKEGLEKIMKKK